MSIENTVKEMTAKPVVQEIALRFAEIIEELGAIDPNNASLETVACVLIAIRDTEALKTPLDWWQP
jgi:hypothetical protein